MYRIEENIKSAYCRFLKRGLDIIIAAAGLVILAIPLAVAALSIKLCDGGRVLFKQERVGLGGRHFICYKFRTMSSDAPHDCATRELFDAEKYITPIGRFLRRASVDELPQLLNVLKGDMSIVGPRPVIPSETELVTLRENLGVYSVRPGITGLAQVRGRDNVSICRKAAYDAQYVENLSLWKDVSLVFKTLFCVFCGAGIREGSGVKKESVDKENQKGKFLRALAAAFSAQGITAAVSALTVFFLAGKLDAAEYGQWQIYSLAASYSGLFQLGLCDGIYLRLGGKDRNSIDVETLGTQFRRMIAVELVLSAVLISVIAAFFEGARAVALGAAALYMPLFNAAAFLGYILQATGQTALYSLSGIIDRISFAVLAIGATLLGGASYLNFIAAAIFAKIISLIFCVAVTREVVFAHGRSEGVWRMCGEDIYSGSRLMLANLSGHAICGAAKVAIVRAYGDSEFGSVSFVMTLSMLLVQFASQLAMVLFPRLRLENEERREEMLTKLNLAAGLFLPMILLTYLPIKMLVESYLPQYAEGLSYLPILLSLSVLEGRACLVGGSYHKVMRLEGRLLRVNLSCAILGFSSCMVAAYLGANTHTILILALIVTALRVLLLDPKLLCKPTESVGDILSTTALCAVFISSAGVGTPFISFAVFAGFYLWYLALRIDDLKSLGNKIKQKAAL